MEQSEKTTSTQSDGGGEVNTTQPSISHNSKKPVDQNKRVLWIIVAVVVFIGLSVGGYFLYRHFTKKPAVVLDSGYQESIDQVIESRPADNAPASVRGDYFTTLGAVYMGAGQTQNAINAYLNAQKLYTNDASLYGVWLSLAELYQKTGDKKQALSYYKKVLNFAEHPPEGQIREEEAVQAIKSKISSLEK